MPEVWFCGAGVALGRGVSFARVNKVAGALWPIFLVGGCATRGEPPSASPPPSSEPVIASELPGVWHEVQPGETLWRLSARYGLSVEEIADVNGLAKVELLRVGQRLFVPALHPPLGEAPTDVAALPSDEDGATSLAWPLEQGVLLREYTTRPELPYEGLLLAAPRDTPVHAAAAGLVAYVGEEPGYGAMVILTHAEDTVTVYAHLERVQVREGQRVQRRQRIAFVGESGEAESPQLHFEVRSGRSPIDPLSRLPPP